LNSALDVANGFGVLLDLRLILHAELLPQCCELRVDRVEQALLLVQSRLSLRSPCAAAIAEQTFEHRARVVLHRQWLRGTAPRDRVRIRTTQDAGAGARVGGCVHRELERRDLRFVREVARQQLVH
jgi:hypothetical protein